MNNTRLAVLLTVLLQPLTAIAAQDQPLELASPFVDDMILQREMNVPVWGWSKPGSVVTVAVAGQKETATTDEKGKWMATLDPLTASRDQRELTVRVQMPGGKGELKVSAGAKVEVDPERLVLRHEDRRRRRR